MERFESPEEFLSDASSMTQALMPATEFQLGWRGTDFEASVIKNDKTTFLLFVGRPEPLEYARIIADCAKSGFSPTQMTLPTEIAHTLKLENGLDFYYLVRHHPFAPQPVFSGASVVPPGSCDGEIDKFLHQTSPDAAVKPGNPEIDFWIVVRDSQHHIIAVSAGVTWQSGARNVNSVAVAESARRRGLGSLVTIMACQQHFAQGAHRVALGVRASNRGALALYRELGFDEEYAMTSIRMNEVQSSHVH